jgi:glycine dehydrogenase subunit 1
MDYVPQTPSDIQSMLRDIGVNSFEDLLRIPKELSTFQSKLPRALTEMELVRELESLASRNASLQQTLSFLGAGAYQHFIPSAIDPLSMRGEFYTAYTPYQAEASQGTLQVIYEYQSLMCSITGMEVSNASLYDGSSALAEAGFLSLHANPGRRKLIVLSSIHPDYLANLRTYVQGLDVQIVEIAPRDGVADLQALSKELDSQTCAVLAQSPNYFGWIEPMQRISDLAHQNGALFVASVNPISLGLLKPPGEYGADFVVGEGQPLGIPISFGGPWLGFLTSTKKLVHKMSGRIVGLSTDENNESAFCLTLQAREQHIRREKATSNICTNQSLMALRACIYLSLMGKQGYQELARLNYHRAHEAAKGLCQIPGFSLAASQAFFNEFTLRCPVPARELITALGEQDILPGLSLENHPYGSECDLLVCVTEVKTPEEISSLVQQMKHFVSTSRTLASKPLTVRS